MLEPQIEKILAEVPQSFQPKFEPMEKGERVVGTLTDLDADTRRLAVAAMYFVEQAKPLSEAHEREHAQADFEEGGESCRKQVERIKPLKEKLGALQAILGPLVFNTFAFEPYEQVDFRAEGIVGLPPKPEDPIAALFRRLSAAGVQITVR